MTRAIPGAGRAGRRSAEVLESLPAMPGGSAVTVEPGGAVELSGPPADGAQAAIEAMSKDQAVLRAAFADAGLGLVSLGADPLRPAMRVNPGARYRAMEEFFIASRHRTCGCGHDDVDGVDSAQPGRGTAGGLAGAGAVGACAGADADRCGRQLAVAGWPVHRLAVQPATGLGSAGFRALRTDPDCQR